jgi:hypothetical protein
MRIGRAASTIFEAAPFLAVRAAGNQILPLTSDFSFKTICPEPA